jgi:hypothetical protein
MTTNGKTETRDLKLVKEGGAWKIDLIPDDQAKRFGDMQKALGTLPPPSGDGSAPAMDPAALKAMGEALKKQMEAAKNAK